MAQKASKKTSNKAKPAEIKPIKPENRWESGRPRFGLQQFRRGRDHKWHFSGQEVDEEVRIVVREHWWFLVQPALPFLGSLALLLLVVWGSVVLQALGALWYVVYSVVIVLVIATGIWFVWKDLVVWWLETYIVTNKRIIESSGLLHPKRKVTTLDKVQQVGVKTENFLGALLKFGTVHVYLTGGDLLLKNVPNPKQVKDALTDVSDAVKAKKPKEVPIPVPQDPELAQMLEKLAKGKEVKPLEDADEKYYKRDRDGKPIKDDRLLGPRRTFGGVLRIPAEIRYSSGEYTVKYVQRSTYVLIRNLIIPALIFIVLLPIAVVTPSIGFVPGNLLEIWAFAMGIVELGLLIAMGLIYINYVDDVYILTNKRIIDLERKLIFGFESRIEAEYKNIRDIRVEVSNVVERLLDVGNVYVETPGSQETDIVFEHVDHPFILTDEISAIREYKDKVDKAKKENDEKKMLNLWFGTVVTKLEEKNLQLEEKSRQAPPLKGLDLLSAMVVAQEKGLEVVVIGEDVPTDDLPPGYVLQQSPPAGTLVSKGTKLEVLLSKKPSYVDQF